MHHPAHNAPYHPTSVLHVAEVQTAESYWSTQIVAALIQSSDQGTLQWRYFPTVGAWQSVIIQIYSKLALLFMCNKSCWKSVKVDYMDNALRAEDDECICRALFAGMFHSVCRLDFGFGTEQTHGVYISIICRQHRVFLPNHSEERQHGSWIPGKYNFLSLCLSGTATA